MMTRNARVGLLLFTIYLVFYSGFVGLAAFAPEVMGRMPVPGLNLAIVYGFGLILAALLLAVLYGLICHPEGDRGDGQ